MSVTFPDPKTLVELVVPVRNPLKILDRQISNINLKLQAASMEKQAEDQGQCPAENLLKQLSGKWKPQIFRIALTEPVRFNALLRQLEGSNKQSIAIALKELEEQKLLDKTVIKAKPLHIEYTLSEKGKALVPIFRQLEHLS